MKTPWRREVRTHLCLCRRMPNPGFNSYLNLTTIKKSIMKMCKSTLLEKVTQNSKCPSQTYQKNKGSWEWNFFGIELTLKHVELLTFWLSSGIWIRRFTFMEPRKSSSAMKTRRRLRWDPPIAWSCQTLSSTPTGTSLWRSSYCIQHLSCPTKSLSSIKLAFLISFSTQPSTASSSRTS